VRESWEDRYSPGQEPPAAAERSHAARKGFPRRLEEVLRARSDVTTAGRGQLAYGGGAILDTNVARLTRLFVRDGPRRGGSSTGLWVPAEAVIPPDRVWISSGPDGLGATVLHGADQKCPPVRTLALRLLPAGD